MNIVPLTLFTWIHICHIFTDTYRLIVDGNELYRNELRKEQRKLYTNGIMILGQEQEFLGGGFSKSESFHGYLQYFDIWSKSLDESSIKKLVKGDKAKGDFFSTNTFNLDLVNVDVVDISFEYE
ncbi:unnamed protein product, partial [Meganyctiphanes norvegica]